MPSISVKRKLIVTIYRHRKAKTRPRFSCGHGG